MIQLCRFFLFLGQFDCSNKITMNKDGLLFCSGFRHFLWREHINALHQGTNDLRI